MLVVPHARAWRDDFALVFVRGRTCVISVREGIVEAVRELAGSISMDRLLSRDGVSRLFTEPVDRTVGPAFQGYCEAEGFRAVHSDQVRMLGPDDDAFLQRLALACDNLEWEHSCVKPCKPNQFGLFVGDQLVAVAGYDMWAPYAASIGVICHPAYRGRGNAKAAASRAMQHAFEHGHLVVYQTLLENTPSVRLATSLGCKEYGRTMAVHLQEHDDKE
jgi:GNAT superfamily N-acetyltransferase